MKIGIIGAGNIGGTLTRRFAALGHAVSVANSRSPETLRDLAAVTGATAASVTEAAHDKDLVVVTIPEKNVPDLPDDLFAGTGDVVIVDTGNYYPQQHDGRIDAIEGNGRESLGPTAARSSSDQGIQQHLRGSPAGQRPPGRYLRTHRPAGSR
jgi:predicted dinucleotide-binding enzyme